MRWEVPQNQKLLRTKIKFMSMIRSQQGKTGTTKSFKELEIRIFVEKSDKGNDEVEGNSRKSIN